MRMRNGITRVLIWIVVVGAADSLTGQTQVDLRTQSKEVDFSNATETKPLKLGSVLPAVCSAGDMFFNSGTPAGQNLYGCTSTNTWTLEASGSQGGSGTGNQLASFAVTRGSSTALNIGAACAPANPCNARFGSVVYSILTGGTASLSSGTGTAFIYVAGSGQLTVGHNLTLTCSSGCLAQSGVTSFPPDSIPLATWTATGGAWDSAGGVDFRAFISTKSITSGVGLLGSDVGGVAIMSVDTTVIGLQVAAPSTSSSACTQGSWATDGSFYYLCVASNTWKRTAIASW